MAIITISRGTLSGGQTLAECIAAKLGYRCISREVLLEASQEYSVAEEKLFEALTKKPGFLERLTVERIRYLAYIRSALTKEAKSGNLVYHGHAGHLLLEGVPHLLRVRVIANMEFRIEAAMERYNLNREEAIEFIKNVDDQRVRWTKFLYHVDWCDSSLYDIVINLDHISLSSACEIVCHTVSQEQYDTTLRSQKIIDDLALSSYIKAMLVSDKSIGGAGVEVEVDGGVVTLIGTVEWVEDVDKIERIVRTIPGIRDVVTKMRVRLGWGDTEGIRMR